MKQFTTRGPHPNVLYLKKNVIELPLYGIQQPFLPLQPHVQAGVEAFYNLQAQSQDPPLSDRQKQESFPFLQRLGKALHHALFSKTLFQHLNPHTPLLLHIQHPKWSALPWELLCDGGGWLALRQGIVRIASCHQPPWKSLGQGKAFRMVALGAQPLQGAPSRYSRKHNVGLQASGIPQQAGSHLGASKPVWPAFSYLPQSTHHKLHASGKGMELSIIPHSRRKDLEHAWHIGVEALLLVAECVETGWYLESIKGEKALLSRSFLLEMLRRTLAGSAPLLIFMDGYAHEQPLQATARDAALIQAGAPAVLRMPHTMQSGLLHGFLSVFFEHLNQGEGLAVAYRSTLRKLAKCYPPDWMLLLPLLHLPWSLQVWQAQKKMLKTPPPLRTFGLTTGEVAAQKSSISARLSTINPGVNPSVVQGPLPGNTHLDPGFRPCWQPASSNPARPQLLEHLLQRLQPKTLIPPREKPLAKTHSSGDAASIKAQAQTQKNPSPQPPSPAPFLCISAPKGMGKTQLLAQVCQRMGRVLHEVVWLNPQSIANLPPPHAATTPNVGSTPTQVEDAQAHATKDAILCLQALAMCLHQVAWPGGDLDAWATRIAMHSADGQRRLIILNGLEKRPGFVLFVQALLGTLPITTQLVVLCIHPSDALLNTVLPSPTTPATQGGNTPQSVHLALQPLSPAELGVFLGDHWMRQTMRRKDSAALLRLCGLNLLLGQLLARMARWPSSQHVLLILNQQALSLAKPFQAEHQPTWAKAGKCLLEHVLTMQVSQTSPMGQSVLFMLGLFPAPLSPEVLSRFCKVRVETLNTTLQHLESLGLLSPRGMQGELTLPSQIQHWAASTLVSKASLKHLYDNGHHSFGQFLRGLLQGPQHQIWPANTTFGAWCARPPNPAQQKALHHQWTLHAACINLNELCTLLGETQHWNALQSLVNTLSPWLHDGACSGVNQVLLHSLGACFDAAQKPKAVLNTGLALANALLFYQNTQQAKPVIEHMLGLACKEGNWEAVYEVRGLLGRLLLQLHEAEKAQPLLEESLTAALQRGQHQQINTLCRAYARAWQQQQKPLGSLQSQLSHWVNALERQGAKGTSAEIMGILAKTYLVENRLEEAHRAFEHAIHILQKLGSPQSLAHSKLDQAICLQQLGKALTAWKCVQSTLTLGLRYLPVQRCLGVLRPLAKLLENQHEFKASQQAYALLRQWLPLLQKKEPLEVLDSLGHLYHQLGQTQQAAQTYAHRLRMEAILQTASTGFLQPQDFYSLNSPSTRMPPPAA